MKQSNGKPDEEIAVAAQKNEPTPPFENAGESQTKKRGFWEGLVSFQGRARRIEFWGVLLATLAVFFPLFCCCVFFSPWRGRTRWRRQTPERRRFLRPSARDVFSVSVRPGSWSSKISRRQLAELDLRRPVCPFVFGMSGRPFERVGSGSY